LTVPHGFVVFSPKRKRFPSAFVNPRYRTIRLSASTHAEFGHPERVDLAWSESTGEVALLPNPNGRFSLAYRTIVVARSEWDKLGIPDGPGYSAHAALSMDGSLRIFLKEV
jgi:hypothetical protein